MALFNKGDKVICVSSNDKGIIVEIGPCGRGGRQLYKVNYNGIESDELEGNLISDCNMEDPFERCRNNIYGSFIEFSKNNTTFKIKNSNISTISSLKASKTLFRAYQFKPLLKFLNSDNKRILVADEVGLGKTIEAGHIMLELKARNEFRNALVICPLSLQEKWKSELKDKFGLTFTIIETSKELIKMLQDHDGTVRAIINYEKIRSVHGADKSEEKNNLLKFIIDNNKKFSFILCDEAHKMRNETTQTYKGAEKLMEFADSAVFLTATPIMISERNLYNLLHLLDNQRYSNYHIFEQGLRENAPFIKALSDLSSKKSLLDIADELANSEITIRLEVNERVHMETHFVKEHFKEFPLFKRIMERMTKEEDTLTLRSQLQYDIMSMSQMNKTFSRTRKREVTTDWSQAERHPYPCIIPLYEEEQKEYDLVIENYIDDNSYTDSFGEQHLTAGGALGLVQKKRQIASSVYAYLNEYNHLIKGYDAYADKPDAKFDELVKVINEVFKNGQRKIIVFALFKKTLYYLSLRLKSVGFNSVMIHGDIDERQSVLNEFQNNPNIQILLSSEVGSEGLDMQFCDSMVNYDLPWNPMIVEQRIGRIDRFGQKSPIVHIYNMIVKDSIQEDIYLRLLNRIGIFHESIGDMEAILDAEVERNGAKDVVSLQQLYSSMEKEFFCKNLSREERQRKIDEIAQAFINEKENIKKIEEGLTNALTNDAYFKNEISRILNNNAYVTEEELKSYIQMLIKEHLTTCQLNDIGDDIYTLVMPKSNSKVLVSFLMDNQPTGDENYVIFKQFINSIRGITELKVTFNQEVAYKNRNLIFINLYNPIIQATLIFFAKQFNESERTFRFDVDAQDLGVDLAKGKYFLSIYQVETSKIIFGTQKISNTLQPFLYSVNDAQIINDNDLTSRFYGKAQVCGKYQRNDEFEEIDSSVVTEMQIDLAEAISSFQTNLKNELQLQAENSALMLRQQTQAYYQYRIDSMNSFIRNAEYRLDSALNCNDDKEIRNAEGALRLHRSNLQSLQREMEYELERVSKDQELQVRTNLLSINYINVK